MCPSSAPYTMDIRCNFLLQGDDGDTGKGVSGSTLPAGFRGERVQVCRHGLAEHARAPGAMGGARNSTSVAATEGVVKGARRPALCSTTTSTRCGLPPVSPRTLDAACLAPPSAASAHPDSPRLPSRSTHAFQVPARYPLLAVAATVALVEMRHSQGSPFSQCELLTGTRPLGSQARSIN
jgi:hypothetical protein